MFPASILETIKHFNKLPGVGPKTAERFVFHLLNFTREDLQAFGNSIAQIKDQLRICQICYNLSEKNICSICSDTSRDNTLLCVIADTRDLVSLEHAGVYKGLYYVLGGTIDTLRGITPDRLRLNPLLERLRDPARCPQEIILGFNPNLQGEGTILYLKTLLNGLPVKITQFARGLPTGGDLEYADV